jgi:glutathione S-transferase
MTADVKMLTFAPMVDSECTRLVLTHYRIPFVELDHIFGWASLLTLFHLGYGRIPLVYGGGLHGSGPRSIVNSIDDRMGDRRLLPPASPLRDDVERSWALYNGELAVHVAVFAYYHLLPSREAMIGAFQAELGPREARLAGPTYGAVRALLSILLRLTATRAAAALSRIRAILDETDRIVVDGRSYLHGGRLTLADLGLLSALEPLALPARYQKHVPPVEQLPEEFRNVVEEARKRPVSTFAERLITFIEA